MSKGGGLPGIRDQFPDGFVFGAATSAYQIEGHQFGGAGETIWDEFARKGGVVRAQNGKRACEHYHRFDEDIALLAEAGFDAYRFSFSWARLFPDSRRANEEGVAFYDRLIDGLLEKGIRPFATAYHWDLPLALGESGGWKARDTALRFGDHVALIVEKFGDRLASLATINEPWCVAWLSHFLGEHAPGEKSLEEAAPAIHHVLLAHSIGAKLAREGGIKTGIVLNFTPGKAASDAAADRDALAQYDALTNALYLDAITRAAYPKLALDVIEPSLPRGWEKDMAGIGAPLDFLGINYYTSVLVRASGADFPAWEEQEQDLPRTDMGWVIDPASFGNVLDFVAGRAGALPLYVTENGMAAKSGCEDRDRIDYFSSHLDELAEAAKRHDIRGYFAWSLLDNFEWAHGFEKRFGIIEVDYETMERRPKASYGWWKENLSAL